MAKKIKFKVVVEVDGKDVASEYIGYQFIQAIVNCHTNWGEPHNYESVFKYAATYPHSSVRCEVGMRPPNPS